MACRRGFLYRNLLPSFKGHFQHLFFPSLAHGLRVRHLNLTATTLDRVR